MLRCPLPWVLLHTILHTPQLQNIQLLGRPLDNNLNYLSDLKEELNHTENMLLAKKPQKNQFGFVDSQRIFKIFKIQNYFYEPGGQERKKRGEKKLGRCLPCRSFLWGESNKGVTVHHSQEMTPKAQSGCNTECRHQTGVPTSNWHILSPSYEIHHGGHVLQGMY